MNDQQNPAEEWRARYLKTMKTQLQLLEYLNETGATVAGAITILTRSETD